MQELAAAKVLAATSGAMKSEAASAGGGDEAGVTSNNTPRPPADSTQPLPTTQQHPQLELVNGEKPAKIPKLEQINPHETTNPDDNPNLPQLPITSPNLYVYEQFFLVVH